MSFDPIAKLREAGAPVDQLTHAQRGVIASLTPEETAVITSVNQRIAATGTPDVEGHTVVGVGIF